MIAVRTMAVSSTALRSYSTRLPADFRRYSMWIILLSEGRGDGFFSVLRPLISFSYYSFLFYIGWTCTT